MLHCQLKSRIGLQLVCLMILTEKGEFWVHSTSDELKIIKTHSVSRSDLHYLHTSWVLCDLILSSHQDSLASFLHRTSLINEFLSLRPFMCFQLDKGTVEFYPIDSIQCQISEFFMNLTQ